VPSRRRSVSRSAHHPGRHLPAHQTGEAVHYGASAGDRVLCGHSYGGMVITGVADRVPARLAALVYLDAFVPADGESTWDLTNDAERNRYLEAVHADGFTVRPQPFFDARAMSHPLASFLQAIRLTGAVAAVSRRDYVYASAWTPSPFGPTAARLERDPAWTVHTLAAGHNLMRDAPDDLMRMDTQNDFADAGSSPIPGTRASGTTGSCSSATPSRES